MKKSLIAVAIAGAFAAPAAMAEVTISGAINLGVEYAKTKAGTNGGESLTRTQLGATYSHMDLESVDDIGGGNKVIFHYQFDISGTSSAQPGLAGGAVGNRNSFLGVAGGWGAFKMGTNENVYERMMYTADPLDGAMGPGGNLNILGTPGAGALFQVGQNVAVIGPQVDFYRRSDQTVWYESPNFSGFSFEVDGTLSAFKTPAPDGIDPRILSVGGKFQPDGAPFYVDLAYEQHKDMFGLLAIATANGVPLGDVTHSKDSAFQLGGGLIFGDLSLHLRFERLKYEADTTAPGAWSNYQRDAGWFAVKYNLPSGYVGGELGIARDGKTNFGKEDNTGARMFGVGYFHNLSKQSQLNFVWGHTDNKSAATYGQAGTAAGAVQGADGDVFHVGIKHTF
jgi:predicted porin